MIRRRRSRAAVQLALYVTGFAGLSAAAWLVAVPAGLAVAGLSCFALEWLTGPESEQGRRAGR